MGDVIYSNNTKSIDEFIHPLLNFITSSIEEALKDVKIAYPEYTMLREVARTAVLYKHRAFSEEREVRMVFFPCLRNEAPPKALKPIIQNRNNPSGKRHIAAFGFSNDPGNRLPIKRIIVGPGENQRELRQRALDIIGKRQIEITCSDTPYIG